MRMKHLRANRCRQWRFRPVLMYVFVGTLSSRPVILNLFAVEAVPEGPFGSALER